MDVTRAYRPLPPSPDPPSGNANLSNLLVSDGNLAPAFSAAVTSYTLDVGNSVSSLTVTPQVAERHATVKANDIPVVSGSASEPIALNAGANTIKVVVTAENGTTKTYTVTVNRAAVL